MEMSLPSGDIIKEVTNTIALLNDEYFNIVKKIYCADIYGSKMMFLATSGLIEKIINGVHQISMKYPGKELLNMNELNRLMSMVIQCYEENNPQGVSDILLFDLCSVLNECSDEIEKISQMEG